MIELRMEDLVHMLTAAKIDELIASGRLIWDGEMRGDALLLRLGSPIQPLMAMGRDTLVDLADQRSITGLYRPSSSDWSAFDLAPGHMVLCQAATALRLGAGLLGAIAGLSHLARVGLGVHITSPWVLAGWDGHLTLEVNNQGPATVRIYRNMPAARLIIFGMDGAVVPVAPHTYYGTDPHYLGSRFADEFPFEEYAG